MCNELKCAIQSTVYLINIHMDYFNDLLATFLSLDRVRILAVYGRELSEFIKNIFVFRRCMKVLQV